MGLMLAFCSLLYQELWQVSCGECSVTCIVYRVEFVTASQLIKLADHVTHAGIPRVGDKPIGVCIMEACRGLSPTALVLTVARSFWSYKIKPNIFLSIFEVFLCQKHKKISSSHRFVLYHLIYSMMFHLDENFCIYFYAIQQYIYRYTELKIQNYIPNIVNVTYMQRLCK